MAKRTALFLAILVCWAFSAVHVNTAWASSPPGDLSQNHLKRIINGKAQDLTEILERTTIVIRFPGGDSAKESEIQSRFGLKKIGPVNGRNDLIVFEFFKPPVSTEEAVYRWKKVLDSSEFASLVFAFPEGRYALSGAVKIQWKKFLSALMKMITC